jgi:hypothetical protein
MLASAESVMALPPDWPTRLNLVATRQALCNSRGLPLRFVSQACLPPEESYEAFIDRTGGVPTRANLHDFFNALIWLTYPAAKSALNAIQAGELVRQGSEPQAGGIVPHVIGSQSDRTGKPSGARGKLRDRATIFDENAALLLCADPAFEQALRAHDWQACFAAPGTSSLGYEVRLFGHALLEKLVAPYKAITAHVWVLSVEGTFFSLAEDEKRLRIDSLLSMALEAGLLGQPPTPLPVLGVPGWWPQQDADFYADETVFRKKRTRSNRP